MAIQRFSQQRDRIYQEVAASREHPTAQDIYDRLKEELPRLSLGTVYRNLHQLAQDGQLQELEGVPVRFDGTVQYHTHFRCGRCGGVIDLTIPYDEVLDRLATQQGCVVDGHNLMFYGMCSACAEANKE